MIVGKDMLSGTFKKKSPFLIVRVNGTDEAPWEENLNFLNCQFRGCSVCVHDE
jgi:hypothetical protein